MKLFKRRPREDAQGVQVPGCLLKVRTYDEEPGNPQLTFQAGTQYSRLTYDDVVYLADRLDEWITEVEQDNAEV